MRWGMAIDLKRCIGCYGCQLSCKAEHGTPPGVFFARLLKQEEGRYPTVRQLFLPVLCFHCDDPPCVDVCPTEASFKWPDGIVDIDAEKCVGCRACMMACPYTQRYYHDEAQYYFPGNGPTPYERAALWSYGDFIFTPGYDMMSDTLKLRRHGFWEVADSEEMFLALFAHLRRQKIIP